MFSNSLQRTFNNCSTMLMCVISVIMCFLIKVQQCDETTTTTTTTTTTNELVVNNFIAFNRLADGEHETRIYLNGLAAKETTVDNGLRGGLKLRQLSDGRHFIQLIYDGADTLRDCEYVDNQHDVHRFLKQFRHELSQLLMNQTTSITNSNSNNNNVIEVKSLDHNNGRLPETIAAWFNYTLLRDLCKQRHLQIKHLLADADGNVTTRRNLDRSKRSLVMPGTVWCGVSDASFTYTDLGKMDKTDKCCRRHDNCRKNILPYETKFNYYNSGPFTVSHCFCDARYRRDLSDLLRVPGTKWCGKGYSATKFTQLGGFSRTDKCCRVHDTSCPFWIGGFDTKYGLFNWRMNTLMHCRCDERFRACLKVTDTSDSNLVGKIFFNIVQTKCFILRPKKICTDYTWWGKCKAKKLIKQAILKNNPRFN